MVSYIQNVTFYNPDDLSQLESDIPVLKTDVSGLKTGTSGLIMDINALKTGTSGMITDISALKSGTSGMITDINALKTGTSGLITDVSALKTGTSGMITDVSQLKQKLNITPVNTKDLTALSNNTYVYDTPFEIKSRWLNASGASDATGAKAQTTGIITFPSSPADGDFITLVDSANVFGGEVDTYSYSTVVITINFNGKVCKGECSAGSLLPARKGQVTFKFSTALNKWTGFLLKQNDITQEDPWTGYWVPVTYTAKPYDWLTDKPNTTINNSYIYLDATKNPIQLSFYEGTPNKPYNKMYSIQKSRVPFISVTGTNVMNTTQTLKALVKFDDPKFGIHQVDQKDIGSYSRYVLDPADPTTMYFYGTQADVFHFYGGDQFFNNIIYKKISQPLPYVKSKGKDDQQMYSFGDPVVLFDWYCDIMTKNCNINNNAVQNKSFYGDSYKIKTFIESVKKDGFSVTTPIKNIISNNGYGYTYTTFNTKENCHYCPPGSNITISGFSGAYAVLNNYYTNGVTLDNNSFQNYMHSGTMDYNLTNGIASGSVIDFINKFAINYDSSSGTVFPRSTGANALYGQGIFEGNPVVTVIHKVTSDMTYNEWIAACLAVKEKIHGPQTHSWINYVYTFNPVKLISDWTTDVIQAPGYIDNASTRAGGFPSSKYVSSTWDFYDPYQARVNMDALMSADSNLNYGGYVQPNSGINPLIIRNYLQTGTVANLWYAMDKPLTGTYANTFQKSYSTKIGSKNLSNPSLVGGSQFVCEMKPYPYQWFDLLPDLTTWNLNAGYTNNGYSWNYSYYKYNAVFMGVNNYLHCGLINSDLVASLGYGSKKVAYLRIPDTSFFCDSPNYYTAYGLNVFNTPVTGAYQHTGALGQLYFSSVISKYINSLGADALILDDRNCGGGYQPQMFFPFFGGDRLGVTHATPLNDDGYGPLTNLQTSPDIVNSNQLYSDFSAGILPTEMERLFPGSVFKGTTGSPKKIVILHDMNAASGNDVWIHGWLGDNYDGNIGGNVTCSFLGDSDGRILGGYGAGGSLPVDYNSKVHVDLAYYTSVSSESSASFIKHLATGPVSGDVYYHNIYPETSIRGMSAGATGTLTSVSGNKCFPNSYESTIYQDWGYIPPQPSAAARWIPSSRPLPTPNNLYSYRDAWLENAIREALYLPSV